MYANYDLNWVPKQVWDSRINGWRQVLDAIPYANPNRGDFDRVGTSVEFSGDAFTNTTDQFIAYKRFSFLAKGLDSTPVELSSTVATSIDLLEFMLVEFQLGTTEQLLQKRPVRISTILEGRDEHYYEVAPYPVVLPPSANFRIKISGEIPVALFQGPPIMARVRMHLTAIGAMLRVK